MVNTSHHTAVSIKDSWQASTEPTPILSPNMISAMAMSSGMVLPPMYPRP